MKSLKFYKILSITLVIINLGTLAFFYFNRPPEPPPRGKARLADKIGLTGADKKKSDALEIRHHKDKKKLVGQNFKLQQQLYESLADNERSQAILSEIHKNRMETNKMTYEFFSEISMLCNDKQRKELDKMIKKGLRRITNQPNKKP